MDSSMNHPHEPQNSMDKVQRPTSERVPRLAHRVVSPFGWRHAKGIAVIRVLVAVWLVILASICFTFGLWGWGVFCVASAGAVAWLAYVVPRWKQTLDAEKMIERVRELELSRALVVDDATARLRRIEQDLHDGAQSQMVAVVMKLGLAREHLAAVMDEPGRADLDRVMELVDAAHLAAKGAIADLRDLAHGIYPSTLDKGLAAALTALAARSTVPVELHLELEQRPSPAIETIAYFCVAELLTNIAKHSNARHVTLDVAYGDEGVKVRVSDDGVGGATINAVGGLGGLLQRVRSVDGSLELTSPRGGPTVINIHLPNHA